MFFGNTVTATLVAIVAPLETTRSFVAEDEKQPTCAVCSELFVKDWNESLEEWVYVDVVRISASDLSKGSQQASFILKYASSLVHVQCRDDAYALASPVLASLMVDQPPEVSIASKAKAKAKKHSIANAASKTKARGCS